MSENLLRVSVVTIAVAFTIYFCVTVVPAVLETGDVIGAFAAGFVNPFSSGYSTDVIACWVVLLLWLIYEASAYGVRGGWICVLLGVVPGVVVGLAAYLVIRSRQISEARPSGAV